MNLRPLSVVLICLVFGVVVGYAVFGHFGYESFIGLGPTAFPAGEALQDAAAATFGDVSRSVGGLFWSFFSLVVVALVSFFWVRRSVRSQVESKAPGRRSFLTGAASGVGAALGATALGTAAGLSRVLLGVGNQGRGWVGPAGVG